MRNLTATSASGLRLLLGLVVGVLGSSCFAERMETLGSRQSFLSLPLYFEPVRSDASGDFQFVARGQSRSVQLSAQRAMLSLVRAERESVDRHNVAKQETVSGRSVAFDFVGANPMARLAGEGELPGRVNYFIGSNPSEWRRGLSTFTRVRAEQVYPGVDLIYYGNQSRLEYDFIVQPGAHAEMISFRVSGADKLRVDVNGDLVITLGSDEVRQLKPIAYQEIGGERQAVYAAYRLRGHTVSFELGDYDRTRPLVIDPVLYPLNFFNGSGSDILWDVAHHMDGTNGFLYVAGETLSANLPATPGAFTNQYAGGSTSGGDAFVAKIDLSQTASNLVFLTYLGGRSHDGALSLATDGSGNAYLTGYTASTNFPTVGALRTNLNGGVLTTPSFQNTDAFIAKLSPDGSNLVYSAFLGGSGGEQAFGIAVNDGGVAYVTGFSDSTNFPTMNTTLTNQHGGGDVFLTSVNSDGQSFAYSFLVGGLASDRGESVTTDPAGNAYVAGFTRSSDFPVTTNIAFQVLHNRKTNSTTTADAFLFRVSPAGLVDYATYFGGESDDVAFNLVRDDAGALYLCGSTTSTNFILTATNISNTLATNKGFADAFVTKFDSTLTNLIYSIAFGGPARDEALDIAPDTLGRLVVVGDTLSTSLPVTNSGTFLRQTNSGSTDAFAGRVNATGTAFDFLGYVGGKGNDLAYAVKVDGENDLYFVGQNGSDNFPGAPALGGTADGFVIKIADLPARLVVSPGSLVFNPVLTGAVTQASFVVTNAGSTLLNATASLTSDSFFLLTNSSPVTNLGFAVSAFTAKNIPVRFAPTGIGGFTNEVVFVSNGGDSTNTVAGVGFGTPVIVEPGANDTEFFFSFETTSGVSYDVQFKNAFDTNSFWQILQTISGDGTLASITNLMIITNLTDTSTQRFFRLRAH